VAVGFAVGPEAGLAVLDGVADDPRLAAGHQLPAVRADFYRRLGRRDEAAEAYRAALARVGNAPERSFLRRRLTEVSPPPG
jgi:RNA polymerase sigma-70 factor, ECF subfamily